jgi:hypothetical protein
MYKASKSQSIWFLIFGLVLFFLAVFASPVVADEDYGNLPPDVNMMGMSSQESVDLPFDPNDYTFLVYNPGGQQSSIRDAMSHLGILNYDERNYDDGNEVTPEDLATHDILIVGWNYLGNTTGLDANTLLAGITGRVILTGHDLDYHESYIPAARTMLIQAIDWVLKGGGTGMITLGCTDGFPYLPEEWDVNALPSGGEDVDEFTEEGLASGVYNGLEPNKMSNWGTSYHDVFTIGQDSAFVQFELGGDGDGNDIITIARLWPGYEVELTKTDDVNDGNSVLPGDYIMYTISYANPITDPCDPKYLGTLTDVNIVDYLPNGLEYCLSDPCGIYNPDSHTVTWNIGTLEPNESNSVTLTVIVNECVTGCGIITNTCEIKSGDLLLRITFESTPVSSASNPNPACGEIVDWDVNEFSLTWCPGHFAADVNGHEVYFGSNFNDANNLDPNVYKARKYLNKTGN